MKVKVTQREREREREKPHNVGSAGPRQRPLPHRHPQRPLTPDTQALVANNLGLVDWAIRLYTRGLRECDWDACWAAGEDGLIRAAQMYDPVKGWRFSTYACWWVRQAVQRWLATRQMQREHEVAFSVLGREGQVGQFHHEDNQAWEPPGDAATLSPDASAEVCELLELARQNCPPRCWQVLCWTHMEGWTYQEVARELAVSKERVRQLHAMGLLWVRRWLKRREERREERREVEQEETQEEQR